MTYFLHQNDIPSDISFGSVIAIDTETMGLNLQRDRLCLVQLSSGDGNAHLIQITTEAIKKKESFSNLKKYSEIINQLNYFILLDLILLLLKKIYAKSMVQYIAPK